MPRGAGLAAFVQARAVNSVYASGVTQPARVSAYSTTTAQQAGLDSVSLPGSMMDATAQREAKTGADQALAHVGEGRVSVAEGSQGRISGTCT